MTPRNGIFITPQRIAQWKAEEAELEREKDNDAKLERELNERNQRRKLLRRKLEAAEIFADEIEEEILIAPSPPVAAGPGDSQEPGDSGDSAATDLVANLRKTGDSLKVQQVRQRLIDIGHAEAANRKNYIYGLVYRLTKRGKLIKRGTKYRAAPITSLEGEAGAVGAPVRN